MAINIIERAVTPYNSPTSKIANKEQYSLYAPAAGINKPGMAGYAPKHFAVREQIVELSGAFLDSILHHVVVDENFDSDGIKETNTLYSNFSHTVLDRIEIDGEPVFRDVTGSLLVFRNAYTLTEVLFADGRLWTRNLEIDVDTNIVAWDTDFLPIYDKCVTDNELALDSVGTRALKNGAVSTAKLVAKAVTTEKLDDAAVTPEKISREAVTTEKLNDEAVTTEKLNDAAVTTEKISPKAITTEKLNDAAVTTEKISPKAITTEKLNDAAVTTEKISPKAITTEKLAGSAVTTDKLYSGAVTEGKLSPALMRRLLALENDAFTDISYDQASGVLTFKTTKGQAIEVDLPLELIVSGGTYDEDTQDLVLRLANGDAILIPLDDVTRDFVAYVDGIRESIYVLQKAPPLVALADAVLLTTPTLAVVAGIT